MNTQIVQLFGLTMLLFAVLIGFTSNWSVFAQQDLEDRTANRRPLIEEQRIPRGLIRASDGTVIARSVGRGRGERRTFSRTYPTGPLFSHAVGYSFISRGRAGLERSRNDELTGKEDEFENIFSELQSKTREGQDVITTLDPDGQRTALQALGGRRGSVVALEPQTGRVRVMVSVPEYDPNDVPERFSRLARAEGSPLFNRATQSQYPPGSTFKVVTAAAALDSGKFKPDSIVDGSSPRDVSGVPLANSGGQDFGPITLTDALTNSVNTVWAQVGEQIGRGTLVSYMERFGFNQDPPLDYPDDQMRASGVRDAKGRILGGNDGFDVGRVAIGQGGSEGAILVSPLQMAMVAGAIGNGGALMQPRLTDKVVAKDGRLKDDVKPAEQAQVMSRKAAGELAQMMGNVVEEGTGTAAALSGIRVGGKTGTAEVDNATANQAWFIGFAPLDGPRMAIAVTIERTQGQGGTEAAPIAKTVLEALLGGCGVTEVANDTTVDGRYKILGRIGSGGMADVYLAQDTHLGREVALKVLHRRFAQDAEFVERFRREAKAAAGLQHANVVGVYDRGDHDGTYYIAMEHLRGRTLKDIVNADAPLDQVRVIDLGVQILQAAGFAHKRGIIHRDFKPHNVIVDEEGIPKVTDFGIARAGASEMTETGSIMGTAQYLSPEQAQGHAVTAASDLYSIGVMLYEMLTGRLPFEGDSAVSIALKHLSEPPPPMQGVEPNLEGVVMGALAKDPAARWQTAEDFAEALEACRPYVEAYGQDVSQDTAVFAPVPAPAAAPVAAAAPPAAADRDEEQRERRWPMFTLVLLVLALIGLMAYAFSRPEESDVPKVTTLQLSDARERLDRAGFEKVEVERERSFAQVDRVLRQDPDPGEQAAKDDTVTLIVSGGPGTVVVPSVKNTRTELAIRELEKAELKVTADPQPSDSVKKGFAIGTSPEEGDRVARGSRVRLFVSSGPEQATMPDVVGLTREAAETRLTREGLEVRVVREASDKPEDEVIAQTPAAGTKLDKNERVTITISEGKKQVDVPNLVGLPEDDARRVLRADNLDITVRRRATDNEEEDGQVLDQRPGAGVEVDEGRSVIVFVGRFDTPENPADPGVTPEASP